MINLSLPASTAQISDSPFDSIRRYDEKGNEYWLARELMKLLGYRTWQKFCDAIDRAKMTCRLNEELEASHINHLSGSVSASGRFGDDYRLSRKACYWVAMTGDTRKPEIAQAHQYFAVKTREAEVLVPVQSERIHELELMVALAEAEKQRAVAEQRLLDTRDTIIKLQPRAVADRILGITEIQGEVKTRTVVVDQMGNVVNAGDTLTKTQIAHELGIVSAKGKADTKLVADLVKEAMEAGAIPMPWRDERTVIATGFDAELLPKLKAFYRANPIQRQQWIGE